MRIALAVAGEVAVRAGRILLGEATLDTLGVVRGRFGNPHDDRARRVDRLEGFDLLVTDEEGTDAAAEAAAAGIGCVTWYDCPDAAAVYGDRFSVNGATWLVASNLAGGLVPALASHESARDPGAVVLDVAWTEPGDPLRTGIPVPFPDPVGMQWAHERPGAGGIRHLVAPVERPWGGATMTVVPGSGDPAARRIVGIADLAVHLEALALAAGAMAVAAGSFPPGVRTVADSPGVYLERALVAGLEVAVFSETPHD